jgi:LAO/AO transport system kinase
MGDGVQAAKAGILEIGDVYVVNKADREGADQVRRDLRAMLSLGHRPPGGWRPPVVLTVASRGEGIDELVAALDKHGLWQQRSGELARRRRVRARDEIEGLTVAALRERVDAVLAGGRLQDLAERVATGALDPYAASDELLRELDARSAVSPVDL